MPNLLSTITRPRRPWKPPVIEAPHPIDAASLTLLGVDRRGRRWFAHAFGELRERPRQLTDAVEIPNAVLTVEMVDGARRYTLYDINAPGSFAAAQAAVAKAAKPKAPQRFRDMLVGTLADRVPEAIVAPPSHSTIAPSVIEPRGMVRPARGPVRGCEALDGLLRARGCELVYVGGSLIPTYPAGKPAPGVPELLHIVAKPLLLPWKRDGVEPDCALGCGRKGQTVIAAEPEPLAWCGECAPAEATKKKGKAA